MFLFLFDQFVTAIENIVTAAEQAMTEATDAYGVAAVACAMTGVRAESPYQAMPQVHPRTVRRVLAGAGDTVRMCMSDSVNTALVHKDSSEEGVLDGIRELAEKVKVAPGVAEVAVTRYGNSPDRVRRVLDGITTLVAEGCKVWNPTGLFTRLMRSGGDVKLPARVVQARAEAERQAKAREERREPAVGLLVRFCGEVCRIVDLTRQFAVVENAEGITMNAARDRLQFV